MRCSVYIATSLDGFIAREDGAIDWLPVPQAGQDDYGYTAFMSSVDALVMGRNTYELVQSFGQWPYGKTPAIVLSTRGVTIPERFADRVESMAGDPSEIVGRLAARGMKHLYIDGGDTVRRFLAAGLITELIITRVPVLIGRGIPLFGDVPGDVPLRHTATYSYPTGLVQSRYDVVGQPRSAGAR